MEQAVPLGTDCFQGELAPSGHMVLPRCEYSTSAIPDENTLTLVAAQNQFTQQETPARTTGGVAVRRRQTVPPPPLHPPMLPARRAASQPPPPLVEASS